MKQDLRHHPAASDDLQPHASLVHPLSEVCLDPVPENPTEWVAYHRLELESTGENEDEQPLMEPVLHPARARLVKPSPGALVRGTLVDCPEAESGIGCVVIDTGSDAIAVQSAALCCLVIEHAPCCLEFVAVAVRNSDGQVFWDWEAYELSPYGARILVSHSHEESRKETADQSPEVTRKSV